MKAISSTILASVMALALTVSNESFARDWYVNINHPNASDTDTGAGTEAQPFRTLSAGVAAAEAGDNVIVKPGRYSDPNATWYSVFTPARSGEPNRPITIKSDPPLGAVLVPLDYNTTRQSTLPAMSIYQKRHIVVDGFKAEGMIKIHNDVQGDSQYVTIQNCEVLYGSQQGDDASLNWGIAVHVSDNNVIRNNLVHSMRSSGNTSENTAAIMNFASSYNLIENNDADASNGNVYSAFGQKAGNIHNNTWRRNIARNAPVGFLGKGGTGGATYADNETFYQNIIINVDRAFHLNHNSRYWRVYNNTAYNVRLFHNQWQLNSVDNQFWNNIVSQASGGAYQIEALGTPTWTTYIAYSNYNFWSSVASTFAKWQDGASSQTLSEWRAATNFDANSLTGDPLFVNAAQGNFKLQPSSPARGAGRDGVDMGAYPTGNEVIGVTTLPRPRAPMLSVQ